MDGEKNQARRHPKPSIMYHISTNQKFHTKIEQMTIEYRNPIPIKLDSFFYADYIVLIAKK